MTYCSYSNCTKKNVPCSNTTFFNLPKDHRREIWIKNSGNWSLRGIKPNANRQFCEHHFDSKFLRRQFTRTVLRRDAVPFEYSKSNEILPNESEAVEFEGQANEIEEPIRNCPEIYSVVYREFEESPHWTDDKSEEDENTIECTNEEERITEGSASEEYENVTQDADEYDLVVEMSDDKTIQKTPTEPNTDEPPTKVTRISEPPRHSRTANFEEDYEDDKNFALSLLCYFKRLPRRTKSTAKLKILQYLTELEWENTSEALG